MVGDTMAQIESTTNLSTLTINMMEANIYKDAVASEQIDDNQLYMTPINNQEFEFFVDSDRDLCIRYFE